MNCAYDAKQSHFYIFPPHPIIPAYRKQPHRPPSLTSLSAYQHSNHTESSQTGSSPWFVRRDFWHYFRLYPKANGKHTRAMGPYQRRGGTAKDWQNLHPEVKEKSINLTNICSVWDSKQNIRSKTGSVASFGFNVINFLRFEITFFNMYQMVIYFLFN